MGGVGGLEAAGQGQDSPDKRMNDVVCCGTKSGQEVDDELLHAAQTHSGEENLKLL